MTGSKASGPGELSDGRCPDGSGRKPEGPAPSLPGTQGLQRSDRLLGEF